MTLIDHVMMRVEDLDASLDWYQGYLDYEEAGRWEADTFTNVYLAPRNRQDTEAMVELTYNHDDRTYDFGDAWGHIALRVEDVYEAYDALMDAGVTDYRDPDSCGGSYAFVRDPDGHEIELVERDYGTKYSIDHVMLRVADVERSIGWWTRVVDYELTRREEFDSFALYFMGPRNVADAAASIELTYNYDGRTYDMGDAWGHVALDVDDLQAAWDRFIDRGAEEYRDPESCDYKYAFTKTPAGHEVEILTQ